LSSFKIIRIKVKNEILLEEDLSTNDIRRR